MKLPDPKPVTHINGKPIEEFNKEFEESRKKFYEVDPEDEQEFLEKENDLNELRLDNEDLRKGKRPLKYLAIWGGISALALIILKVLGYI